MIRTAVLVYSKTSMMIFNSVPGMTYGYYSYQITHSFHISTYSGISARRLCFSELFAHEYAKKSSCFKIKPNNSLNNQCNHIVVMCLSVI